MWLSRYAYLHIKCIHNFKSRILDDEIVLSFVFDMNLKGARFNSYDRIYNTEMFLASVVSKPGRLCKFIFGQ